MQCKMARVYQAGGPEVIRIETVELAEPGAGEVRIRHTAIGFNFQDIYTRSGMYAAPMPTGLGTEAGMHTSESPGQRVAAHPVLHASERRARIYEWLAKYREGGIEAH